MGKKDKDNIDDFDFDTGGELFPLDDDIFSSPEDKPPKGVKGYLKNIVKSVGRMSLKIGKTYMPDTFDMIESTVNDSDISFNGSSKEIVSGAINNFKSKASKYKKLTEDTGKQIYEETKKSVKTGTFFKDREMDMSDFFGGDMGFDDFGGSDDGTDASYNDNEYDSSSYSDESNEETPKKAKFNKKQSIYKGRYSK